MTAGYSGTPLAKKLGIKPGCRLLVVNAPDNYDELLKPLPEDVEIQDAQARTSVRAVHTSQHDVDLIHLFTNSRDELFSNSPSFAV